MAFFVLIIISVALSIYAAKLSHQSKSNPTKPDSTPPSNFSILDDNGDPMPSSQQSSSPVVEPSDQRLRYFCIKDKGYHVTVWPKDHNHFDMVRFNIAGIEYRDNINEYLGESVGVLEAEPTNPYDPNAIKILAHDGHHVGYVPKDMTDEVRKVANLPCPCFFYIGKRNGIYFSDCYIKKGSK